MEQVRPVLEPRWEALGNSLMSRRDTLHSEISTSFQLVSNALQGKTFHNQNLNCSHLSLSCGLFSNVQCSPDHSVVAREAIEILLSLLSHRRGYITYIFDNALAQIIQQTEYAFYKISIRGFNLLRPCQIYKRPYPQWPQQQFADC